MKVNSNLPLNMMGQSADQMKVQQEAEDFKKKLEAAQKQGDKQALKKVTQDFESIFVTMMLKSMRSTVQEGGLIEKSHAREMYEGMLDEEMGKMIATGRGIGLADLLYKQMEKQLDLEEAAAEREEKGKTASVDLKG